MNTKSAIIEALLFSEGGPMRKTRLAQLSGIPDAELESIFDDLSTKLSGGLTLVRTETEVALVISNIASEAVRDAYKKELGEEIGDAGLEVLAIILYRGASTRAQVDYVRGVNTASTIRNLMARGLIERVGNPLDGREYLYRPTVELLAHLGVNDITQLPGYESIVKEIQAFEKQKDPFNAHADTADTIHND